MFVTFDICTDVTINLNQITFWDFTTGERVFDLADAEKLAAINGTSKKYCIYSIDEIFANGDIGDYEFVNVEVRTDKLK